jgi:alpha-L-rhamnosidase
MNYGFTTWPERQFYWDEMDELTNSLNHPMHSGFAAYFYESLGGIKSSQDKPGYKEFLVNPVFPKAITQTAVDVSTPFGNIQNSWEIKHSKFSMQLNVPFNTKARLTISVEERKWLKINGDSWEKFQAANKTKITEKSELLIGSGCYLVEYVKDENNRNN